MNGCKDEKCGLLEILRSVKILFEWQYHIEPRKIHWVKHMPPSRPDKPLTEALTPTAATCDILLVSSWSLYNIATHWWGLQVWALFVTIHKPVNDQSPMKTYLNKRDQDFFYSDLHETVDILRYPSFKVRMRKSNSMQVLWKMNVNVQEMCYPIMFKKTPGSTTFSRFVPTFNGFFYNRCTITSQTGEQAER